MSAGWWLMTAGNHWALPPGSALVTGGAGGLGSAIVEGLASCGTLVATMDLADTAPAGSALHVACDINDEAAVRAGVESAVSQLGPVSMLVCAAGAVSQRPYGELDLSEWRRIVDASLTGAYVATRAVVPAMAACRRGAVVAFSSGLATRGLAGGGHYAAAKAGTEGLVKSLALEYAPSNVRINAVAPGPIRTSMLGSMHEFDEVGFAATIPMGRLGKPLDVVGPVLFLLGEHSAYMTGQTLHVNGGFTMR